MEATFQPHPAKWPVISVAGMASPDARPSRRVLARAAGIGIAVGVYGISFGVLAVAAGLTCSLMPQPFAGCS